MKKTKEQIREYLRKWRDANPEKDSLYSKKWRAANPDKVKRRRRQWVEANPGQNQLRMRKWRDANPEQARGHSRKWRAANIEYERLRNQQRRSKHSGVFIETVQRVVVFNRANGICGICRLPVETDDWHIDHIIPIAKGGVHSYDNVQLAHATCNLKKSASLPIGQPKLWQVKPSC